MQKGKIYKIKGMDCEACAKMIELDLEDEGIPSKCSFAKQTLQVDKKYNKKKIEKIIQKSGYKLE